MVRISRTTHHIISTYKDILGSRVACELPQLDMHCGSRVRFFFVWKRLAMNRNQKHCQRQMQWNAFCIQSIQFVEFHDIAISAGSSPRRFRREGEVWGVLASFHVLGQAAWQIMFTFHLGTVPMAERAHKLAADWLPRLTKKMQDQKDAQAEREHKVVQSWVRLIFRPLDTQWLRQIVSKAILVGHVVPVYSQNAYMGDMCLHHFQFWTPT